ncbi:molecular chaperone of the GrpE family [Heterobasidion irregulare TC 32-1]|uniref:GrpE protein homolog n=1 Tax=Heterobasidion irregulare (strain TC 32-1) TaxID=747525 RepID=W4KLJ9_HETIT|nr:molecular chaperone of the GrpE family [Heterobasidion irregulare TC 32-1]ETW85921.1 molecular chaperone of the GrpE family [Heterobasidion irregulare TC 32-1]
MHVLRAATTSLSPRAVARASIAAVHRRPAVGQRWYSDEKAPASEKGQGQAEAGAGAAAEDGPCAAVERKLKAKEEEAVDLTGRLRYLQADFLNLQRNAAREKEQTRDFAVSRFAGDLLETVDVLALALKSSPAAHLQELYTGVEITHRLLLQTLFKYQIKPFDPTGDKFDPNRHEALYQAPIPGKEPGTVIDCQKTGYMIKDRVLRAAQVGVVQES